MATINFPATPTIGDIYTFNGRSWQWNGTGWQTVGSPFAIAVGTTPISGGTSGRLFFDSAGIFGEISGVTTNGSNQLTIGTASSQGNLILANTSANSVTVQSSNSTSGAWTMTLPTSAGTSGYVLATDGAGVTSWVAGGGGGSGTVNSGTSGQLTYYAATGTAVSGNANATISGGALTLGQPGSITGEVILSGSGSGAVTVAPATAAGTWTFTLPTSGGTNGYVLSTDGTGATSWIAPPATGITVNTTTITGGTSGRILYDNAGTVGELTTGTGVATAIGNNTNTAGGLVVPAAALTANALVIGGGSGTGPSTTTTGTGVVTAIGNAVNTAGGLVVPAAALTANAIVIGGGSGTGPSTTTTGTGVVTAIGNNTNSANGLAVLGAGGALAVANGGTGTTTAFTAGSVVFAGASGVYTQNNAQFFWDNTNNRLGLGTATPGTQLYVSQNAASAISALGNQSGTVTLDMSTANNFSMTLTGTTTLANPSNLTAGQSGVIYITQDATGGRTMSFGTYWDFPYATAPSLTTTANAIDVLVYTVQSTTAITAQLLSNIG